MGKQLKKLSLGILLFTIILFISPKFTYSYNITKEQFITSCINKERTFLEVEKNMTLEEIPPEQRREAEPLIESRFIDKLKEAEQICRERSIIVIPLLQLKEKYNNALLQNSTEKETTLKEIESFVFYIFTIFDKIYYEDINILDNKISIEGGKIRIKNLTYRVTDGGEKSIFLRKDGLGMIKIKVVETNIYIEQGPYRVEVSYPITIKNNEIYIDDRNKISHFPLQIIKDFNGKYNKTVFDIIEFKIVKKGGNFYYKIKFFDWGKFLGFIPSKYVKSVYYDVRTGKLVKEENPFFKFLFF